MTEYRKGDGVVRKGVVIDAPIRGYLRVQWERGGPRISDQSLSSNT